MIKSKLPLLVVCASFLSCIVSNNASSSASASFNTAELFEYSSSLLKRKEGYLDSSSGKKGLLLYGYENGMSATFKSTLSGIFSADIVAVKENGTPTVASYSLTFKDVATEKEFKVGVNSYSSYSEAYVSYNGEKAAVKYYQVEWNKAEYANGFSAGYNAIGQYTQYQGNETKLQFDPSSMTIKVVADNGSYINVWDFSSTFNDGKRLENDLGSFGDYTVSLTFEKITPYYLSPLLINSFAGYSFESSLENLNSTVNASFVNKAVVGVEYKLPLPNVTNPIKGKLDSNNVSVKVFDSDRNVVSSSFSFIPKKEGYYYVYYEYKDNEEIASNLYKLEAISSANLEYSFSFEGDYDLKINNKFGIHSKINFPKAKIKSNSFFSSNIENACVEITKSGQAVSNSFGEYSFDEYGEYEITYYSPSNKSIKDTRFITISKEEAGYALNGLDKVQTKDTLLKVEPITVYKNEKECLASPILFYPSGRSEKTNFLLNEIGNYKVQYEYSIDGVASYIEESFVVYNKNKDLFKGDVSYAGYGDMVTNNSKRGVKATLFDSASLVYSKTIDLSDNHFDEEIDDYTKNTKLIELYSSPHSIGNKDAEGLYVILTDAHDKTNQISIRMKCLSYMQKFTRVRAKATGQGWVGYYYDFDTGNLGSVDDAQVHEDGGFISSFDFTGGIKDTKFENTCLQLYFDNNTGKLYCNPWQLYGTSDGYKENRVSWLVRDFSTNDSTLSGGDSAWTGFSTGEVILSIYATGVSNSADFYITNIDGEDLSSEYQLDNNGPEIELSSSLPNGEVNKFYRFPSCKAKDDKTDISSINVNVYRGNELLNSNKEGFTPNTSGEYSLVYVASDYFGNKSQIERKINVVSSSSSMSISLNEEIPLTAKLGDVIELPSFTVFGGVGSYKNSVSVTSNGKEVEVKDNKFRIESTSKYIIRFVSEDYVGNTAKLIKYIDSISVSSKPVFDDDDLYLPSALFEGDGYSLNGLLAKLYSKDGSYSLLSPSIIVKDGAGERKIDPNEKYYPVSSEETKESVITLRFGNGENISEITKVIPILKPTVELGFIAKYFYGDECEIKANDNGVNAVSKGNGLDFSFVRSLFAKEFSLDWNNSSISSYKLTLKDSLNKQEKVELDFYKEKEKLYLSINDGDPFRFYENGDGDVGLVYKEKNFALLDSRGIEAASISTYADGSAFKGFSSGQLYFGFSSSSEGSLTIKKIDNQIINNVRKDSVGPSIYQNGNLSGRFAPGSEIKLPEVICFDVLSNVKESLVTISKDGAVVKKGSVEEIGNSFLPDGYGSYKVTYTFKDDKNNRSTCSYYFSVADDVIPTLDFSSSLPTETSLGSEITLPSYQINDQNKDSVIVNIYCIYPSNEVKTIKDNKIRFDQRGVHTINYLVIDENKNVNFYSFQINVK